jgi:hypothetical protein
MRAALDFVGQMERQETDRFVQQQLPVIAQILQAHDRDLVDLHRQIDLVATKQAATSRQIEILASPWLELVQTGVCILVGLVLVLLVRSWMQRFEERLLMVARAARISMATTFTKDEEKDR